MTKVGARTAAGGAVTSSTSKKAIGEMLDAASAEMKKDFPNVKGKDPKKTPKPKDPEAEKIKSLQKDIKAFLIQKIHSLSDLFDQLHVWQDISTGWELLGFLL